MASSTDLGAAIRVHGDLHLGRVLRDRRNWVMVDFEGDVAVPLGRRRKRSSPMRDVAAVVRSFHYAAELAVAERLALLTTDAPADEHALEQAADPELAVLASAWEERAVRAFVTGYTSVDAVHPLLRSFVPYAVALVSLDDAPHVRLLGNVLGRRHDQVAIGDRVRVVFEEVKDPESGERLRIPQWEAL